MKPNKFLTMITASLAGLFIGNATMADEADTLAWLFVHTAETAEMTSATTLVMPVTREIFAFTDRPNRLHAYLNAHEFVSLWYDGEGDTFTADPPNAVLTWNDGDVLHEAEVVLSNATISNNGREIVYEVELAVGDRPAGDLTAVSLFIDDTFRAGGYLCTGEPFGCTPINALGLSDDIGLPPGLELKWLPVSPLGW